MAESHTLATSPPRAAPAKLAFSLVLHDDGGARRLVESVRAAGFSGIEPTFFLDGTLPTAADARESATRLRRLTDQAGLVVPSLRGGPGFWTTFASDDAHKRAMAVELAKKAFDAMAILGSNTLLIVPGQWEAHQTYARLWANALETARLVAEAAQNAHMTVGLENVGNSFILSPREWMQFLDEIDSPSLRMYFDVGNVVHLRLGHPEQWLRQLGRRYITRIHFKDADVGGPVKYLLEGAVNWPAVRAALQAIRYDDWIGIELPLPDHHAGAMLAKTYRAAEQILSGEQPVPA